MQHIRSVLGSLVVVAVLAQIGCAPAETPETETEVIAPEEARAAVDALRSAWVEHFNMGHPDMVADMYAEDAVLMGSEGSLNEGRGAIAANLAGLVEAGGSDLRVTSHEMRVQGAWVADRGAYELQVAPEGEEPAAQTGHYVILARVAEDGQALIHWHIANQAASPPAGS